MDEYWWVLACSWYNSLIIRVWRSRLQVNYIVMTALIWNIIYLNSGERYWKTELIDHCSYIPKVHPTPKYFFRSHKSLQLFETHCAFLPRFNPNLDILQAVKVTKSGHHLLHDRGSKGYGSIPGLMSQTSLHACLQRVNTMQISLWHQTRNRPMPFTSSVVWQMMARFRYFHNLKKVKT